MMEAALVIALDGSILYRHAPVGRSAVSLPDDRALWDAIWNNRNNLAGIAHSHPGDGFAIPSLTDETTASAVERALGRTITWWIVTCDHVGTFRPKQMAGEAPLGMCSWYSVPDVHNTLDDFPWLTELRSISGYNLKDQDR